MLIVTSLHSTGICGGEAGRAVRGNESTVARCYAQMVADKQGQATGRQRWKHNSWKPEALQRT